MMRTTAFLVLALCIPSFATAQDETTLRAADEAQREAALTRNVEALESMTLSEFRVNSPEGDVGTRDRMLGRFRNREVGHDRFNRIVEAVTIKGAVGVVMGREIVVPSSDSIAGQRRQTPSQPVLRRFTNIWLWQDGGWKWLSRHANETAKAPAANEIPKEPE